MTLKPSIEWLTIHALSRERQGVGTKRLNRQFNMAHIEAGYDPASTELYLERNIYEDEQILAEISSTISAARKAGFETL